MDSPLISIIVPFYNHRKYIDKCLQSLETQTHKNTEIIIIDDCSTIPLMMKGNFALYRNKRNMGIAYSTNRGIQLAEGEYIKIFDDDDIAEPDMLECGLKAIYESDRYWSMGGVIDVTEKNKEIRRRKTIYKNLNDSNILDHVINGGGLDYKASLFKKELFAKVGLFNEKLLIHHDTEWFLRCLESGFYSAYIKRCLYRWRHGSTNIRKRITSDRYRESTELWREIRDKHISKEGI